MLYLDTSVLGSSLTREKHSLVAQDAMRADDLYISRWVEVELAALLSAKCRSGKLNDEGRKAAWAVYRSLCSGGGLGTLMVDDASFTRATELALEGGVGLRGADVLHLAIATLHGATLCTLDRRQAEAGQRLGLAVKYLL